MAAPSDKFIHRLSRFVDKSFYLNANPDVRAAGVDPVKHYIHAGRFEGRAPCELESVSLEKRLWQSHNSVLTRLMQLTESPSSTPIERVFSSWSLARYFAFKHDWASATGYISVLLREPLTKLVLPHDGPTCLAVMCLYHNYTDALNKELKNVVFSNKQHRVMAEIMSDTDDSPCDSSERWNELIEGDCDLIATAPKHFDELVVFKPQRLISRNKKVSVIVPCFNAANTIRTALVSLKQQSYANLEIIIVNDASTDESKRVIEQAIDGDNRFRLITFRENKGAYYARNEGASQASGDFITVMDADDWAHPLKIEKQAYQLIKQPWKKASISHWARATDDLCFTHWRIENGWIHRNVSSLMIRRSVLGSIGYWDEVKANADTEYYYRILARFGANSIIEVAPGRLLSIGRAHSNSLTSSQDTHISTFILGTRAEYNQSFKRWHTETGKRRLKLPLHANFRQFSAPIKILRNSHALFDAQWYTDAYGDVAKVGVEPLKHYDKSGKLEGREPSPHTSLVTERLLLDNDFNLERFYQLPVVTGQQPLRQQYATWILFGHAAGESIFGAERSLLDIAKSLSQIDKNIVVVLPECRNVSYLRQLQQCTARIHILPMPWWRADRGVNTAVKTNIEELFKQYQPEFCYINTLTLWEPVIAANASDIQVALHVRELPETDYALCEHLHASPQHIAEYLKSLPCELWANSMVTQQWLNNCDVNCTQVIYNGIDVDEIEQGVCTEASASDPIVVGMLSSNLPKKGIKDFYKIQRALRCDLRFKFKLFGPETKFVKIKPEENYQFMGYVSEPTEAIGQCDVILCLSHFQESFGRTAAEAMAAGRVVIAYDWGALGEVVGDAGILVRKGDVTAVSDALIELSDNQSLVKSYSAKAKKRAEIFSLEKLGDNFVRLSDKILNG